MSQIVIFCPAEKQEAANQAWLAIDPIGGAGTFTVPLNATGDPALPVTSYWTSFYAEGPMLTAVTALCASLGLDLHVLLGPQDILAQVGLATIEFGP